MPTNMQKIAFVLNQMQGPVVPQEQHIPAANVPAAGIPMAPSATAAHAPTIKPVNPKTESVPAVPSRNGVTAMTGPTGTGKSTTPQMRTAGSQHYNGKMGTLGNTMGSLQKRANDLIAQTGVAGQPPQQQTNPEQIKFQAQWQDKNTKLDQQMDKLTLQKKQLQEQQAQAEQHNAQVEQMQAQAEQAQQAAEQAQKAAELQEQANQLSRAQPGFNPIQGVTPMQANPAFPTQQPQQKIAAILEKIAAEVHGLDKQASKVSAEAADTAITYNDPNLDAKLQQEKARIQQERKFHEQAERHNRSEAAKGALFGTALTNEDRRAHADQFGKYVAGGGAAGAVAGAGAGALYNAATKGRKLSPRHIALLALVSGAAGAGLGGLQHARAAQKI